MLKHGWGKVLCCYWGWMAAIRGGINGLFNSQVSMYTFCLHLSYTSILQTEKRITPPFLLCNRILSALFPSVSLYRSCPPSQLFHSITQHSYKERRDVLGALLWDSAGDGIEELPDSRRGGAIAWSVGCFSLVLALSFNFKQVWACDNYLLERSDCWATWLGCWGGFCSTIYASFSSSSQACVKAHENKIS